MILFCSTEAVKKPSRMHFALSFILFAGVLYDIQCRGLLEIPLNNLKIKAMS